MSNSTPDPQSPVNERKQKQSNNPQSQPKEQQTVSPNSIREKAIDAGKAVTELIFCGKYKKDEIDRDRLALISLYTSHVSQSLLAIALSSKDIKDETLDKMREKLSEDLGLLLEEILSEC